MEKIRQTFGYHSFFHTKQAAYLKIPGIIFLILDPEGCISEINDFGCKILEMEREKIIGLDWIENFFPGNMKDWARSRFVKILKSSPDEIDIEEITTHTAKTNKKIIRWYKQIIKDGMNRTIGVCCIGEDITEFRIIQTELKKNKDLFKGLLATIADGIVITNTDGTIIYVNKAAEKLFDRPLTGLLGENFGFPVSQGKPIEIEIHQRNKNMIIAEMRIGESEWNGDICYIASLRNVTERKFSEKRQNLAAKIFRILNEHGDRKIILDNILKAISIAMDDIAIGVRLYEDRDYPFFHTIGIPSEMLEREKYVFIHNPDNTINYTQKGKPQPLCLCGRILNNDINLELECMTKEGSFFSANISETIAYCKKQGIDICSQGICEEYKYKSIASILLRSGNNVIGLLQLFSKHKDKFTEKDVIFLESIGNSIALTISRLMLEQHIHASEERFRNLFEESPTYCLIVSEFGYILDANRVTLENWGYPANELIGRKVADFYTHESREKILRILNSREREIIQNELMELKTKSGEIRTVLLNANPIFDNPGKIFFIILQQTDITEQKQLEMQFLQMQKMEAIGTLSSGIAHDFNNVLTIIKSYSEFLLDKCGLDNPCHSDLNEIHAAAVRAASLTQQLLAFSRKQVLKPRKTDLNQLVTDLSKMLQRIIREDIHLKLLLDKNLPRVIIDPGQMEQVIMNLAVNSRDAMKNGGICTIATSMMEINCDNGIQYPELKEGLYICLQISDTGCGIEEKILKKIFDPFFTTKEPGKGTGLGLSVVYGIIRQHGGSINVVSEINKGTTFNIYLPVDKTDKENHSGQEPKNGEAVLIKGSGKKILYVEDDTIIRRFMAGQLRNLDFDVKDVVSAEEVMALPESYLKEIDLLFCDIVLPGKSGLILVNELQAFNEKFKILFTSGYSDEKIIMDEPHRKDMGFLSKPYSFHEILLAIGDLLF